MACPWNINSNDEPDEETGMIVCRCDECHRYADLYCERDFRTGSLMVSVMTCRTKGGPVGTREVA